MNAEPSVMIPISPAVDATGLFRNSGVHVSPPVASRLRLTNTATTCATTNTTTTRAINQRGTRRNSSTNRDFSFFLRSRINRMRSFHAPLTCSVPFIVFPRLDLFGVAYSGSPARPFQIASTTPVASSAGTAHHITKPTSQISFGAPVRCPTHSNARHTQGALAIPSAHETPAMLQMGTEPFALGLRDAFDALLRYQLLGAGMQVGVHLEISLCRGAACCTPTGTIAYAA